MDWIEIFQNVIQRRFFLTTVTGYCPTTRQGLSVGHPIISAFSSSHSWPQRLIMSGFPNNGFLTRYDLRKVVVRLHSMQYFITEFCASSSPYSSSSSFPSIKRRRFEVPWDFQILDCPLRSEVNLLLLLWLHYPRRINVSPLSVLYPPTHILRYLSPVKNAKLS